MAIFNMPASPVPAGIKWRLRQPSQVNRSEWTSRRKVTMLPGAPMWTATVSFPIVRGEANILPWRSFFAKLQGKAHSFRLIACEGVQITGVAPQVRGGGQSGTSLVTDGWGGAGQKLKEGQFVTINEQLLQLRADVVADADGIATIYFLPWIRTQPADDTALIVERPTAIMSMVNDDNGWDVDRGQKYGIDFACEEAFG